MAEPLSVAMAAAPIVIDMFSQGGSGVMSLQGRQRPGEPLDMDVLRSNRFGRRVAANPQMLESLQRSHDRASELDPLIQQKRQEDFQREFAQMGVRWRVADAKAAGLHPLAALGTSGASATPVPVSSVPDGQNVSGDATRQQTMLERIMLGLQIYTALASAERDFAQASALRSEARRNTQAAASSAPLVLPSEVGAVQPGPSATAQRVQDEYGDIVENVYGLWRLIDDFGQVFPADQGHAVPPTERQREQLRKKGYYTRPSRTR